MDQQVTFLVTLDIITKDNFSTSVIVISKIVTDREALTWLRKNYSVVLHKRHIRSSKTTEKKLVCTSSQMEHLEEEEQLDVEKSVAQSKSQLLEVDNFVVESEVWFVEVVGLQN